MPASTWAAGPPEAPVAADRSAERGAIDAERRRVAASYDLAKADCQGRFMLTQCLDDARNTRRLALDKLQRRQLTLDDAARRARSAKRLQIMQARAGELRPAAALATAAGVPANPATPARPLASAALTPALRKAAYLQRQQQATAHRDAVLARNARKDANGPPAAGLPVPAAAPASH